MYTHMRTYIYKLVYIYLANGLHKAKIKNLRHCVSCLAQSSGRGFCCCRGLSVTWINLWFGFALYTLRGGFRSLAVMAAVMNVLKSSRSLELVLEGWNVVLKKLPFFQKPLINVALSYYIISLVK